MPSQGKFPGNILEWVGIHVVVETVTAESEGAQLGIHMETIQIRIVCSIVGIFSILAHIGMIITGPAWMPPVMPAPSVYTNIVVGHRMVEYQPLRSWVLVFRSKEGRRRYRHF